MRNPFAQFSSGDTSLFKGIDVGGNLKNLTTLEGAWQQASGGVGFLTSGKVKQTLNSMKNMNKAVDLPATTPYLPPTQAVSSQASYQDMARQAQRRSSFMASVYGGSAMNSGSGSSGTLGGE